MSVEAVTAPFASPPADRAVWLGTAALFAAVLIVAPIWGTDFHRYETRVLFEARWVALATMALLAGAAFALITAIDDSGSGAVRATIAVLLALGLAVLLRLDTFYEAFERDLMIYATIADDLLRGRLLYVDDWDNKPPGVFWTYAAAAFVFGTSPAAIWVLGVGAAVATALACYVAGRELGGIRGGAFAALVWALASGDLLLQANQPNVEVFINLFGTIAFCVCLCARHRPDLRSGVVIGALFAIASLYKQVALAMFALLSLPLLLHHLVSQARALRQELKRILAACATIAAGWVLAAGIFWRNGTFDRFYDTVFVVSTAYAGDLVTNLLDGLGLWRHGLLDGYAPLAGVSIAALVWSRRRFDALALGLLAAWIAGCWFALSLPGRFFPHYFQLLLPPLAVACGWAFGATVSRQRLWLVAFAAAFLLALWPRALQTQLPVERIPIYKYGLHGVESDESRRIGHWIGKSYPTTAKVFHWGAEPGVHFWSGHPPVTRFVAHFPLFINPNDARALQIERGLVAELQRAKPDLVVVNVNWIGAGGRPVIDWLREHYVRAPDAPANLSAFLVLVPK